jgi:hypothetical protein
MRQVIYHESHRMGESFNRHFPAPRWFSVNVRWHWKRRWHDLDILL